MSYWVDFSDGSAGYVDAPSAAEALARAKEHGGGREPAQARTLPYPATPVVYRDPANKCPPFCYTPRECAGNLSCRKSRACDD